VMVGWSATTNRCGRPPGAASSWYFATRPLTASASSTANAARSFADANRTSLYDSEGRKRLAGDARSGDELADLADEAPCPLASNQRAERWSGSREGSGATADRALGEIT